MGEEHVSRVIRRVLNPTQAQDYKKLIDAAIALATEGGYDAVDMRAVAAQAGMSTAKAYQLVGAKDQMLLEALMSLGEVTSVGVHKHPPVGETPGARLRAAARQTLTKVGQNPQLYRALYRAYVSSTPSLGEVSGSDGFGPGRAEWIGVALLSGDLAGHTEEDLADIAAVAATLFLGSMVAVAAGRDVEEALGILDSGIRLLLGD